MRFSQFFIDTVKDSPKDALLKSHKLLVQGGFVEQVASGLYNFLPLGKIVLDKIRAIIKDEMDKSGAIELALSFVTPAEFWSSSGRIEDYGLELLRFRDRKNQEFILGPTFEESITLFAKNHLKSYRNLDKNFYQITLKFRDEIRPRFGLLRAREFIMKDAYSFHASADALDLEFDKMERVYCAILKRLGLDFRVVDAHSGAIGGSGSKEFMVLSESGEDIVVTCNSCDYGANLEAAKRGRVQERAEHSAEFARFHTPGIKSTAELAEFFHISQRYILKCVALRASSKDSSINAFFFVRGDDELEEVKAFDVLRSLGFNALRFEPLDLGSIGLFSGFTGPYGLGSVSEFVFFDEALLDASGLVCGANERDYHFVGVDLGTFESLKYFDLARVKDGDRCPRCDAHLRYSRGIEVGHIFKLGDKYSKALDAKYLDEDGRLKNFIMGCYGIGVTRLISSILEQKADELGCNWGVVAPFRICILISNTKDDLSVQFAEKLYSALDSKNDVILDDRPVRFGEKIRDFELLGFSLAIIIGKGLAQNKVELYKRESREREQVEADVFAIKENILVKEVLEGL